MSTPCYKYTVLCYLNISDKHDDRLGNDGHYCFNCYQISVGGFMNHHFRCIGYSIDSLLYRTPKKKRTKEKKKTSYIDTDSIMMSM